MHHFRTASVHTDEPRPEAELSRIPPDSPASAGRTRGRAARRMLRFAVVGGAGTVVNTAALYVLHRLLGVPLVAASAVAVELAVVHNYVFNNRWTFGMRVLSVRRLGKFNVSMLAGLAVNVLVLWALVRGGVDLLPANLLAIGAALAVNYASSAVWVWGGTQGSSR